MGFSKMLMQFCRMLRTKAMHIHPVEALLTPRDRFERANLSSFCLEWDIGCPVFYAIDDTGDGKRLAA
ncbi:hypothetical protein RRG08_062498 [Elysia crispata]|uniref:Uncharacterized protein n=1 Tax=Elysia crispata TaxID=231223 RepID=A0AAE0ZXX7_9GAST|nr:hypothetical protein RRG08_062498 [Elysia crispata]